MGERHRRGSRVCGAALCAALLSFGWSPAASAGGDGNPELARARVHITAVQFELAQAALDEALRTGDNDPQTTATIYGLVGVVAGSRALAKDAQVAFERQLALDPAAAVDVELGPKIVGPFTAAKGALAGKRLEIRAEPAANGTVTLVVASDPRAMVAGARVVYRTAGGSENVVSARGRERIELRLPLDGAPDVIVSAVDSYGNRLVDLPVVLSAARLATATSRDPSTSRPSRAWVWLGGGALAATASGTVLLLLARSTRSEIDEALSHQADHSYTELKMLDERGARRTLLANIAFGAGLACAITSGIVYFVGRSESGVTAGATPVAGGAAFHVSGAF